METNKTVIQSQAANKVSRFVDVRGRKSKDGEYLILQLPDGRIVRKHINYFKALMGISFTPKVKNAEEKQASEPRVA